MNDQQATVIVATAPFRALIAAANACARAKGRSGIGFDPNRAGGKSQVVQRLIADFGAVALATALQHPGASASTSNATATSGAEGETPDGERETATDETPDGAQQSGDGAKGDAPGSAKGDAPGSAKGAEGDNGTPPPGATPDGDAKGDAQQPGAEGDKGEQAPGDKGDGAEGDEQAPDAGETPPQAPEQAPDAPPPADDMGKLIHRIATDAARAVQQPLVQWINGPQAEYLGDVARAANRARGNGPSAPAGAFHVPAGLPMPAPAAGAVQHPLFSKLLALVACGATPLLVGPAGTGKSYAARAVADALGRTYGDISFSAGVGESALTGWLLPIGDSGRFEYVPSPFIRHYRGDHGATVFLWDEIDAGSPDMLVIANAALANGGITIPQNYSAPYIKRAADVAIIGAANTLDGASNQYSARSSMDAATLDRFYVIQWGVSSEMERALYAGGAAPVQWAPAHDWSAMTPRARTVAVEKAVAHVQAVRERAASAGVDRVVSQRSIQRMIVGLRAGCSAAECKRDILAGWTPDEQQRMGALYPDAPASGAKAG